MNDCPAEYFDGRTAARRAIRLRLGAASLELVDDSGATIGAWPFRELRLVEPPLSDQPVRLRQRKDGGERLVFEDHAFLQALIPFAPQLAGSSLRTVRGRRRFAVVAATVVAVIGATVWAVPRVVELGAHLVPLAWEEALGEAAVGQILTMVGATDAGESAYCDAPAGMAALDTLVARLTEGLDTPYAVRVRVADGKMNNAFATLGGQVVLVGGLIDFAETPEEVAGVLAHEIGHVVRRHPIEGAVRAIGISLVFEAVTGGAAGADIISGIGSVLAILSFSRDDEREADEAAIEILRDAGIDAEGLVSFFRRLEQSGEGDMPEALRLLSTHPPTAERAAAVAALAGAGGPAMSSDDWRALKRICR